MKNQRNSKKGLFSSVKTFFLPNQKQDKVSSNSHNRSASATSTLGSSNLSLPISEYYSSQIVELDLSRDSTQVNSAHGSAHSSPNRALSSSTSSVGSNSKVYYGDRLKSEHYMLPYQPPTRKTQVDEPPTPVQKRIVYIPPIDPREPVNMPVHTASTFSSVPIKASLPRKPENATNSNNSSKSTLNDTSFLVQPIAQHGDLASNERDQKPSVKSLKYVSPEDKVDPALEKPMAVAPPRPNHPPKFHEPAKPAPTPPPRPKKGILKLPKTPNTQEVKPVPPPRPLSGPRPASQVYSAASLSSNQITISPRVSSAQVKKFGPRQAQDSPKSLPTASEKPGLLSSSLSSLKSGFGNVVARAQSMKRNQRKNQTAPKAKIETVAESESATALKRSKSGLKRVKSRRYDYANQPQLDYKVVLPVPESMAELHGGLYEMPPDIAKAVRSKCCLRTGTRWSYVATSRQVVVEGFEKDKVRDAVDIFLVWIRQYEPHYKPKS